MQLKHKKLHSSFIKQHNRVIFNKNSNSINSQNQKQPSIKQYLLLTFTRLGINLRYLNIGFDAPF